MILSHFVRYTHDNCVYICLLQMRCACVSLCGLRFANGANAPTCNCTQHFVLCLLAMSTAHDFRKCYALASLFAYGSTKKILSKGKGFCKRKIRAKRHGFSWWRGVDSFNSAGLHLCKLPKRQH